MTQLDIDIAWCEKTIEDYEKDYTKLHLARTKRIIAYMKELQKIERSAKWMKNSNKG